MLLWIEGFDTYGVTNTSAAVHLDRKYSAVSGTITVQAGRISGKSLRMADNAVIHSPVLTTDDTMVIGVAFRPGTFGATGAIISMYDNDTLGMNIQLLVTSGEVRVRRGTTTIATSTGAGLSVGTWAYLEFKVKVHGSTGTYEVKINGNTVLSDTGVNTKAGSNDYHNRFRLTGLQLGEFDDLYVLDKSGSTNNNFLGSRKVVTLYPNATGDSDDFDPVTGANYTRVNETPADNDTTYVESATTDDLDLYNYDNISNVGVINGIMINTTCRETDVNPFTLITVAKSDTTESDDAGQVIGSPSYVTKYRIMEKDPHPDSSAAWTETTLNSAQFGMKVG